MQTDLSLSHADILSLVRYSKSTGVFRALVARGKLGVGDVVGTLNARGYMRTSFYGEHVYLHRLAWFYVTGAWPLEQIDHKNGAYADNRWRNLRGADSTTNGRNRKVGSNNTSGMVGVFFHKSKNWWCADIKLMDRRIVVRKLPSFEAAAIARLFLETAFFGEYRRSHAI